MIHPGHVLVTGASAGIGEAIARSFSKEGLVLTLVARRAEKLQALAEELGSAEVIACDLSDPKAAEAMVDEAEARSGPVDHLINNAGVQIVDYGWDMDPDEGERMVQLNYLTPLRLIRRCLPGMRERGQGSIVNVSSVAAFAPLAGMAWYGGSKAGLAMTSETLHGELRGSGVHVVTVYPGPVRTQLGAYGSSRIEETIGTRAQVWGEASELGDRVVSAVKKKKGRLVYPQAYAPLRHTPGVVGWALGRFSPALRPN